MAILQGIINLLSRSVGKIFSALFDWAVVALFGRVSGARKVLLSGLMGAAAIWPILVVGVVVPKLVLLIVAFVPLSGAVPPGVIRAVWLALVLLVPISVGVVLRLQAPPDRQAGSCLGSIGRGFPITIGLSAAFVVLLVTVPVLRVASAIRGEQDVHLPLMTTTESYARAAELASETLRRRGFAVEAAEPPSWAALPVRILRFFGRGALSAYVPERTAYFRGGALEIALYPNAVLLRGPVADTARAHGVLVEALSGRPDMLQTVSPEAQELERQIQRVWTLFRQQPEAHTNAWSLSSRVEEIAAELARQPLAFDDWQVIYRQLLQLDRALHGAPQPIEHAMGERDATPPMAAEPAGTRASRQLSTRELVRRIGETGSRLVAKELELARTEVRANVQAELSMAKLLGVAVVGALSGVTLLVVAGMLAIAERLALSLDALAVVTSMIAALGLGAAIALAYVGWRRRVSRPLAVTRKTVTEDMRWVKQRVA